MLTAAALMTLLCAPISGTASSAVSPGPSDSPYSSAEDCATCHASIHDYWSGSPHALSASSPAYLEALRQVVDASEEGAAARKACVWCHAPTTLVTGDLELKMPISREGITCDFCHTVKDVDLDKEGHPFVLDPGDVKRGPFEYSKATSHGNAFSPLHRASPLLCASCHEYTNTNGVAVLSTYSEWKDGPYPARGVPCQDCHMALVPGRMVKEGVMEGTSPRLVNLHRLVGGSARSQVDRGLKLSIESMTRTAGRAAVTVVVANVAAGHSIPGGLSTKSLVLTVGVETADGKLEHGRTRVYRRELKDARGNILKTVPDLFLKAASVGRDTRIKPRDSRTERFKVPIPAGARAIVARLEYSDASDPRQAPRTTLITEARRDLAAR
jgi:hypothetical protein